MIDAIDGVLESAVFGVPHADFGEGVTAAVVPRPGAALTEAAILVRDPRLARRVQGAKAGLYRRFPAAQRDGQGAEGRPARGLQGHLSRALDAMARRSTDLRTATRGSLQPEALSHDAPIASPEPARGVRQDRVDLAGIRQQIGPPLRAVAVVLADLRQQPLELLHVARRMSRNSGSAR